MQSNFKAPFNAFDFFGYLVAGFVVLTALAYGWPGLAKPWELATTNATNTATRITFYLVVAYIVGQLMAFASNMLVYEPIHRRTRWLSLAMLYRALPEWAKERIEKEATLTGGEHGGSLTTPRQKVARQWLIVGQKKKDYRDDEDAAGKLMAMAEAIVRKDKDAATTLERFGSLYCFCRNTSMAFVMAALVVIFRWSQVNQQLPKGSPRQWVLAVVLLAVAAALVQRYVRNDRIYTRYTFLACAACLGAAKSNKPPADKPLAVEIRPAELVVEFGEVRSKSRPAGAWRSLEDHLRRLLGLRTDGA